MLISNIDIPPASSLNETGNIALIDFAHHVGILGPVFLRLPPINDNTQSVEIVSEIAKSVTTYVDGFELDHDELVTQMLDCGVHIAFFSISSEKELLLRVLSSFPRSRIGLTVNGNLDGPESIVSLVQEYREYVGHFVFR